MKQRLNRLLIRTCFGPSVKIGSRLCGGYTIRTSTGGTAIITKKEFKEVRGGNDLYEGLAKIAAALWGKMQASGSIEHIAHMIQAGQAIGLHVSAGESSSFFGLIKEPPPALPLSSGAHGNQKLAEADADIRAAGFLGHPYGDGVRIGASWEGHETLRYAGQDAENSITGFGPPGTGKGVAFQIPALMEFGGASVTIDPSGQLFATCAPELMRRGVRVIPIMPFTEGFPPEIARLAKRTRCLNPMDQLNPHSESFAGECAQLAQNLKAEEKGTGGDPFFSLSGRNLITTAIACVKVYAHPSDQNLPEVYHCLGNFFEYARSILAKPGVPRFVSTQLHRWITPGAAVNKTLLSILETALADLAWLGDEAIERVLRMSSFRWDDLKNGPRRVAVFVLLPVNKLESHKPFLTLCAGAALMGLGNTERGRHRVLFTIDEAALLNHMPILQRAFAESRKRGVQLSVWFQNIHQAEAIYGPAWKNMLSGSDIQVHLRPRDLASAQFIGSQIGNMTEIVPHFSYAPGGGKESVSFSEQGRPVMFPQDVMALPDGAAILIAPGRARNALKIWARPWFKCPDLKNKAGIDPYHRRSSAKGGGGL